MAFLADQTTMDAVTNGGRERVDFLRLVRAMKTTPVANYAFRNQGTLRFANQAAAWGLATPSVSSGAAYGDLDGDGAPGPGGEQRRPPRVRVPQQRRALTRTTGCRCGSRASGPTARRRRARHGARRRAARVQEQSPARGFQSSVDPTLTFGLGARAAWTR
jgi:hypothetical protein